MSKPMTNEQKAVKIAIWNGDKLTYSNLAFIHTKDGAIVPPINIAEVTKSYLTDLNYLVPVAVKVIIEIEDMGIGEIARELTATMLLNINSNTYQPLFDAVHSAIVYLENQNA